MIPEVTAARQALKTPRAAAIAGIVFSILLATSIILIRQAIAMNSRDAGTWISEPTHRNSVLLALNLVPFSGIAFLWFIGVVRDRIGQREDRFFSSVFLGSGLLFVAMLFVATAMAAGLATTFAQASSGFVSSEAWRVGRAVTYVILTTYAMRMAAVFMISTVTIALRIAIMPRWLAFLGYTLAVVLLLTVGFIGWIELLFPFWVFLLSIHFLRVSFHTSSEQLASTTRDGKF